jgi:hypothetical protein|nr:MAG TPA: Mind bomb SH3 repeat domain [Caudoviricetes sp.]
MKYEVGDRVVIRKDLNSEQYYYYENSMERLWFSKDMYKLCGKVCVITKITDPELDEYHLLIDDEEITWYFNNAMLLPANSLEHLIIARRQ